MVSLCLCFYCAFTEDDALGFAFGPLTFAKKYRGKTQVTDDSHKIPEAVSRSTCLGKVHELFDPCGLAAPLLGGFKTDLR